MDRKIFIYCERGMDPSFWAEPVNAVTNGAFIVAGILCIAYLTSRTYGARDWLGLALSALIIIIGVGSFLFHTYATPWAGAADVIPIALFMLLAVFTVVRRAFGAPIWLSLFAVLGFIGLLALARLIRCTEDGLTFGGDGGACFNGSIGYGPAFLVLVVSGLALTALRRPGGVYLVLAGLVFFVSLTARTLDQELCEYAVIGEYVLGTHFLWHLLNGVTLYLVVVGLSRRAGAAQPA